MFQFLNFSIFEFFNFSIFQFLKIVLSSNFIFSMFHFSNLSLRSPRALPGSPVLPLDPSGKAQWSRASPCFPQGRPRLPWGWPQEGQGASQWDRPRISDLAPPGADLLDRSTARADRPRGPTAPTDRADRPRRPLDLPGAPWDAMGPIGSP